MSAGFLRSFLSIVVSLLFLSVALKAQDNAQAKPKSDTTTQTSSSKPSSASSVAPSSASKPSNILDFDADVIEGERSGPSIMVQMDLQAPNLDTLVFQRKNFNDFHAIDMKRKPKYRDRK